jgi:hypothetical protein
MFREFVDRGRQICCIMFYCFINHRVYISLVQSYLPPGDGKILPSVRRLWRRSLVEWGRRPSDPGKNQSAIPASVSPNLDLFREEPLN